MTRPTETVPVPTERLPDHARALARRLLAADLPVLALDFDGTLTEIVDDPAAPRLTPEQRALLARVARIPGLHVAVLSGRALRDAAERVGIPGLTVVGNHGLEIEGWRPPERLERSRTALAGFLAELEGDADLPCPILIEDKGATATVHVRGIRAEGDRDRLLEALQSRLDRFLSAQSTDVAAQGETGLGRSRGGPSTGGDAAARLRPDAGALTGSAGAAGAPLLRLHPGKASVEVRPGVAWDKARALLHLLGRWGASPGGTFYAGDDVTDECVFAELREGIMVKVGAGPTRARYVAEGSAEVYDFLAHLLRESGTERRAPARRGRE